MLRNLLPPVSKSQLRLALSTSLAALCLCSGCQAPGERYAYPPQYDVGPIHRTPAAMAAGGADRPTVLAVAVDPTGTVLNVGVEKSSGSAALDQAAADSVKDWTFRAARMQDGTPIQSTAHVPVRFRQSPAAVAQRRAPEPLPPIAAGPTRAGRVRASSTPR